MTNLNLPTNLDSKNPTAEAALAEQLAAGTQRHFSSMPQMIVGGTAVTPTQAETRLNALAALRNDVTAARPIALQGRSSQPREPRLRRCDTFLVAHVAYVRGTPPWRHAGSRPPRSLRLAAEEGADAPHG